jgi:hypothetical protein
MLQDSDSFQGRNATDKYHADGNDENRSQNQDKPQNNTQHADTAGSAGHFRWQNRAKLELETA